jgi:hypothetical protein
MSDRPCNLEEFKRLQRREEAKGNRVIARHELGFGMAALRVLPDGTEERLGVWYMALPDEVHCAAYGGECQC